jgi:tRNA dimethylallyltransferase
MKKNKVIIIAGPTASGKTSLSIEVANKLNAEIVNFDSLLFYRELNIGTAKPSKEEMAQVTHHMINTHSIAKPINAADYIKIALPIIKEIHQQNKIVILVGGSGFYLQALLYGMFDSKTTDAKIIEKSEQLYQKKGIQPFLDILQLEDSDSFKAYHQNDHYRIRRAVEHFWMTGKQFSKARQSMDRKKEQMAPSADWNIHFAYLDLPKPEHFEIIQKRTKHMIDSGLIQEVETLMSQGYSGEEKPLKSIGYKEIFDYKAGVFKELAECMERISINTRQLAKAQRTWFKKVDKIEYNILEQRDEIILNCMKFAEES